VCLSKRKLAVQFGAKEVTPKDLVKRMIARSR
jgi:hypothetical protein